MLPRGHHICLQVLSTVFANLINVTYGLTIGWFIIYAGKFVTHESPLNVPALSYDEVRWIDVSFYIGALIGTIFLTINGDVFGRKYTLVVLVVPQGFGWLLKMLSTNATETYIGGFLCGFTAGGSVNLIILFVAELADDKFRGRLGALLPISINVGILIIFISDFMLSYLEIAYVTFAIIFLFLCTYTIFPDTPRQLYKIRRKEQAIRSLQLYRDIRDLECQTDNCYQIEVKKMRKNLISESGFDFRNNSTAILKSFTISLILIMLNVYVNWFVMFSLTKYQSMDRDTDQFYVKEFRTIIAICQLVGSIFCLIFVDIVERKHLLIASIVGITISQMVHGVFVQFSIYLPEVFIAMTAFSLHFGVYPLTFVLIPEILPEKVRIYGVSLAISFLWILMLTFSINEQLIGDNLQQENGPISVGCIIFNLLCLLILWICVPPTTRKTYSDIFSYLSSKSK